MKIDQRGRKRIADALGLAKLSDDHAEAIEFAVAAYRKQARGNPATTVGSTLAAIKELIKALDRAIKTRTPHARAKAQKLMDRVRDSRSGLDHEARLRLLTCGELPEGVLAEARALATHYETHPRIEPESEAFCLFCAILSAAFAGIAEPSAEDPEDVRYRNRQRRRFALAVFEVAGLETPNFVAHPERLDQLLAAGVSLLPPDLMVSDSVSGDFLPSTERFRDRSRD